MNKKKKKTNSSKKILLIGFVLLVLIAVISIGTYAIWNSELLTGNSSISTGQIKMSYTETNEITMDNALPMKDEEGKVLTDYFDFQVLSYIKTKDSDSTKRKINYNIILEPITVENALNDNEIKVYLTMVENGIETVVVEPTTIDQISDYILNNHEDMFSNNKGEVVTSYRLRSWIDESVDTSKFNDKKYSYKFRVNINNEAISVKGLTATEFAEANVGQNGLEQVTHRIDSTLQVNSKFATEYRYRGGNVNNYVTFNNETWRIIGIIPTEDTNGNIENRIKIIRDESIGDMKWNGTTSNNWTTATLNTYLNNNYYNTLTSKAKNMIGTTKYYLGGFESSNITAETMWQYERKNGSNRKGYYYSSNPIMQNDASKKIALMYVSDYGYAASKNCTSILKNYDGYSSCNTTNNWLDKRTNTWLLSQNSDSSNRAYLIHSSSSAYINLISSYEYAVRPVLSLSSNVKISGGNGTLEQPYQLSIN